MTCPYLQDGKFTRCNECTVAYCEYWDDYDDEYDEDDDVYD